MTKLILALMCVGMCVGMLAGCASSTMPSPDDPTTAIHEEPAMSAPANQSVASVSEHSGHEADLANSATASK